MIKRGGERKEEKELCCTLVCAGSRKDVGWKIGGWGEGGGAYSERGKKRCFAAVQRRNRDRKWRAGRCRTIRTPKVARGVCQVKLSRAGRKIGRLKAAAPYPPRQPLNLWRRDNVDAAFCMLGCRAATSIPVPLLLRLTVRQPHRCARPLRSPRRHPSADSILQVYSSLSVLLPVHPPPSPTHGGGVLRLRCAGSLRCRDYRDNVVSAT